MVLSDLFETEEVGALARDTGSLEVPSHESVVQVVVVSKVNLHENTSFGTSMTQDLR